MQLPTTLRAGLALGLLALAALACSLNPGSVIASPKAPCSVTTSDAAANALVARIAQAAQKSGQQVTITASSDEVSSLVAQGIAQAKAQNPGTALDIQNPVVCFTPGQMTLSGKLSTDTQTTVDALATITAGVSGG